MKRRIISIFMVTVMFSSYMTSMAQEAPVANVDMAVGTREGYRVPMELREERYVEENIQETEVELMSDEYQYGDLYYTINDDNTVTITGCNEDVTSVEIPEKIEEKVVAEIGSWAFEYCSNLISVIIPDSVTSIGEKAFVNCSSLTSISLPHKLINIGDFAFDNCSSLTNIILPDGVTDIGEWAFYDCSGLMSISLPDSVMSMGDGAFAYCSSLTSIELPDRLTVIDNWTFYMCENLESITVPDIVTIIGEYAFENCESLKTIDIPNSLKSIGDHAFGYCSSLNYVILPDSVISIGNDAFNGCSELESIIIPGSVTSIGNCAFGYCWSLKNIEVDNDNGYYCSEDGILYSKDKTILIQYAAGKTDENYTIPDYVLSIADYAFAGSHFKNVTISDNVTSIGDAAFEFCIFLSSITIPDSVSNIGAGILNNCHNLKNIEVENGNKYYCSENGILYSKDKTTLVQYPVGKTDAILTIPSSISAIGDSAFSGSLNLKYINIPDNVTSLGIDAFSGCINAVSVTISDGITSINDWAFSSCINLKYIVIPDSVVDISEYAFVSCSNLTDVYYTGSEDQWYSITIDHGNPALEEAVIHFNSNGPQPPRISNVIVNKDDANSAEINIELADTEYDSTLFTVFLKDGTMTDMQTTDISAGDETVTVPVEDKEANKAKVFIWDSFETMIPLCDAVEVEMEVR